MSETPAEPEDRLPRLLYAAWVAYTMDMGMDYVSRRYLAEETPPYFVAVAELMRRALAGER